MDVEIEDWYWQAVEDDAMIQAGLLTLDDLTLAEYTRAQEVATARAAAAEFWAKVKGDRHASR